MCMLWHWSLLNQWQAGLWCSFHNGSRASLSVPQLADRPSPASGIVDVLQSLSQKVELGHQSCQPKVQIQCKYLLHHKLINTPTSRSITRYEHSALFIGKTPVWFSNSEFQGLYLCCWHSQLNLLFIPFQSTFKLSTVWPVMSITVTWLKHDKVEAM